MSRKQFYCGSWSRFLGEPKKKLPEKVMALRSESFQIETHGSQRNDHVGYCLMGWREAETGNQNRQWRCWPDWDCRSRGILCERKERCGLCVRFKFSGPCNHGLGDVELQNSAARHDVRLWRQKDSDTHAMSCWTVYLGCECRGAVFESIVSNIRRRRTMCLDDQKIGDFMPMGLVWRSPPENICTLNIAVLNK